MKIYTKTGDSGSTGLFGGARVSKGDKRIRAYGDIDELNSQIGVCIALMRGDSAADVASASARVSSGSSRVAARLESIQHQLFALASSLAASSEEARVHLPPVQERWVDELETWIDAMERELPALTAFILPGGSLASAQIHVARTVCRRAERSVVICAAHENVQPLVHQYLNRLSDALFVCARYVNFLQGIADQVWIQEKNV